jgi:hypothetical protein
MITRGKKDITPKYTRGVGPKDHLKSHATEKPTASAELFYQLKTNIKQSLAGWFLCRQVLSLGLPLSLSGLKAEVPICPKRVLSFLSCGASA